MLDVLMVTIWEVSMRYFVSWIREGKTSRFAHPHVDVDSALEFACEAFKIECSDVWVTDEHGQKVADRVAVAKYADKKGKLYN
jgi:hypothetical protein